MTRYRALVGAVILFVLALPAVQAQVTHDRLVRAANEAQNWLTYWVVISASVIPRFVRSI